MYSSVLRCGFNVAKPSKWGIYIKGDGQKNSRILKSLRAAVATQKARVPGGPGKSLALEKVSRQKVEVAWPLPAVGS
mgnify:CR=1 FL=1